MIHLVITIFISQSTDVNCITEIPNENVLTYTSTITAMIAADIKLYFALAYTLALFAKLNRLLRVELLDILIHMFSSVNKQNVLIGKYFVRL